MVEALQAFAEVEPDGNKVSGQSPAALWLLRAVQSGLTEALVPAEERLTAAVAPQQNLTAVADDMVLLRTAAPPGLVQAAWAGVAYRVMCSPAAGRLAE